MNINLIIIPYAKSNSVIYYSINTKNKSCTLEIKKESDIWLSKHGRAEKKRL